MPGSTPPTSQLDWLISMTAMIVLFWSRATRDLLKSFGWGIAALHRLDAATKLPFPRRPPHSISRSRPGSQGGSNRLSAADSDPVRPSHQQIDQEEIAPSFELADATPGRFVGNAVGEPLPHLGGQHRIAPGSPSSSPSARRI